MHKAIVLGAGMVGSVMAADLAAGGGFRTVIADARREALDAAAERAARAGGHVACLQADLSSPAELTRLVEPFDIVLGALSSRIGFAALRAVIEAGKNFCDIAFFAEDALELDALARARGVTAVVDCGVAPGMSNMICGAEVARLSEPRALAIYVGGLPRERRWPFQYKAAFSPSDVIEEYTRPVRLVEHGRVVVREPLTEPESLDVPGLGTLEAVNTDGLRSLVKTLRVPFMKEKTLRYPGHYDLMRAFAAAGLFGTDEVAVGAARVRPRDLTAALVFPRWTYAPGEEDLTVMRVVVEGVAGGRAERTTWDLLDFYDRAGGATSMSRTTALPCTTVARMIASGSLRRPGVVPPELIGATPGMLDEVVAALAAKGVRYTRRREAI